MFNNVGIPVPPPPVPVIPCNKTDAEKLCRKMYDELSPKGYYPALTGGLLYKDGTRKDIDVVIFRNRQKHRTFEMLDVKNELEDMGFYNVICYGFVTKAMYDGLVVDLFNPESLMGDDYD